MAVLASGCAPLVGVKRLSSRDANHAMEGNVLSTDDLSEPTRIISGTEIHAALRLIAANTADTITIGSETVPLETDRTAAIAATLGANSMLEGELSNFL